MLSCAFMRLEQTVAERTERIRLYREDDGWTWHIELWWTAGLHPYTDEGKARWKWLARYRAEHGLERLRVKAGLAKSLFG